MVAGRCGRRGERAPHRGRRRRAMSSNIVTTTFLPAPVLPAGRPRLVLTGFMGTGKSTAGKEAAERSGRYAAAGEALDTSHAIRGVAGREAADRYLERARQAPSPARIDVDGPAGPYEVLIGAGALDGLGDTLRTALPGICSVALVCESAVEPTIGS